MYIYTYIIYIYIYIYYVHLDLSRFVPCVFPEPIFFFHIYYVRCPSVSGKFSVLRFIECQENIPAN